MRKKEILRCSLSSNLSETGNEFDVDHVLIVEK